MASTLEKLMHKWMHPSIQDRIEDKLHDTRKAAQDQIHDTRKAAESQIRDVRKAAKAQIHDTRKAAKVEIREKRSAARGEESAIGKSLIGTLLGALSGVGLMYFFDPRLGKRRRALLRDKAVRLLHSGQEALGALGAAGEQVKDRTYGTWVETQGRLREQFSDETIPDQQLEARVRSEMGRWVEHLGALDVRAREGVVTLSGPALAYEVEDLVKAARGVRGVKAVENRLTVYERPEDIPALQR